MRGLRALACAGVLLGCQPGTREAARHEDAGGGLAVSAGSAPQAGTSASTKAASARSGHPPPRVKSASEGLAGAKAGEPLPGHEMVVGPGQELVLDFSAGARVRLVGPAIARDATAKFDALRVRDATLTADLTPAAVTADSGFFLTTPSAALSLVRGGRYALRTLADGSSVVFVVSGSLSVSAAGAAFREALKPLVAGERVEVKLDGSLSRAKHSAQTLEQAALLASELSEAKPKDPAFGGLDKTLRTCSDSLRKEQARMADLLVAHRGALAEHAERRMAVQAEIAAQAAKLARAKERLELALNQRAASRLNTAAPANGSAREPNPADDGLSAEARALLAPSP
jgi:hypothetical protein